MAIWIPYLEHDCSKLTDSQKALYGCEHETTYGWDVGKYKLKRCPVSSITDRRIYRYIQAYNRYKSGFLPNSGGWLDQAGKFNTVLDIIESEIAKIEMRKNKDREKNR